MAVPKKKISVMRRKKRLQSQKLKMQNYTQCNSCSNFIKLHVECPACLVGQNYNNKNFYTNILERNSLNIL